MRVNTSNSHGGPPIKPLVDKPPADQSLARTFATLNKSSAHAEDGKLRRQLLFHFYQQALTAQYLNLVAVALAVVALWPIMDHLLLVVWGAWLLSLVTVRALYMRKFLDNVDAITDLKSWEIGGLLGATLSGLSWGLLGLAYDFSWPEFFQIFVLVLLGGLAGVSTTAYPSSLRANMLFVISMLSPIIIRFLLEDSDAAHLFVLFILVFAGCMFVVGAKAHRGMVETVKLRLANEELIKGLSTANQELHREIDNRILAEQGLQQERNLFVSGPVMVFRWGSEQGRPVEYASPNVSLWGFNADALMRDQVLFDDYIHPGDLSKVAVLGYRNKDNAHRNFIELDYRVVLPGDDTRWVFERTIPVRGENGNLIGVNGYLLDITDRKHTEQLLSEEKERIQVTLHSIGDGVITTDNSNHITYMNPVAETMTGSGLEQARGKPLEQVFRALDRNTNQPIHDIHKHWDHRGRSEEMNSVHLLSNKDVTYNMATIKDSEQRSIGSVVVLRDATRILALTKKLSYYASHDALTDALNRREFERCLGLALKSASQQDIHHVLLYIDIDQFKVINDTCGHRAGDELLQRISVLLSKNIRSGDMIARLGGDEFAILLHRCDMKQAEVIADKLRRTAHAIRFSWEGQLFELGISVGAVEIDKDSENVSMLMSAADMACYTAKDLGKNRVHVYKKTDAELSARRREMHWVSHLNQALKENRLALYKQDIMPVAHETDNVERAEVLLRLFDEDGRVVSAVDFLPAIERYGLVDTIDRWVVKECFSTIASGEVPNTTIYAINVSGSSLSQSDFLEYIKSQFEIYPIKGSQICFEITETTAVSHFRNARHFISELKALGCYFALDDFGSGLSSFAYLKDLAVDFLKIDGSFVQNIVNDNVDRALVTAIKDVGHVMLIDTIAEHVEDQAIMDIVRTIGIDYAQGSFVGNPKPFGRRAQKMAYANQTSNLRHPVADLG